MNDTTNDDTNDNEDNQDDRYSAATVCALAFSVSYAWEPVLMNL